MGSIYLDNNATTRLAPEVLAVMLPALVDYYGNPSSQHCYGQQAKKQIEDARATVARLLWASPAEIMFTSGGTESTQLAILGALELKPSRRQIVTTAVEHPSTLLLFRHLEGKGYRVTYLPVDREGALDLDALEEAVAEQTALVSVMWVNNETGVIFPVAEAARLAKAKGALFHTNAIQAVGKIPVDLREVPADLLSFSGHKVHGPKGIGALFVRKGITLPPLFLGYQERGSRGGTENVPGIVALGKACELAISYMSDVMERVCLLRDRLEEGILYSIPNSRLNGCCLGRVPNTTNLRFEGVEAEAILTRLEQAGIAASSGSACSSGRMEPSPVLTAMGLSPKEALASIRFSLSRYTTEEEIDQVLEILPVIVNDLAPRGVSV